MITPLPPRPHSLSTPPPGFVSLGSLASEVAEPRKTMPRAMAILLVVCVAVNILPLLAALSVEEDFQDYSVGTFVLLAKRKAVWLGAWMTVGTQVGGERME